MEIVVKGNKPIVKQKKENELTNKIEYDSQPITVELEWFEVSVAIHLSGLRNTESLRRGYNDKAKYKGRDLHDNLYGTLGEIAFAKATNCYFPMTVNTFKEADVGSHWQIRTVGSNRNKDLIIRPEDNDEHYYVLVEVVKNKSVYDCTIHGWITGKDGKDNKYLSDFGHPERPKAFRIPKNRLQPTYQMPI